MGMETKLTKLEKIRLKLASKEKAYEDLLKKISLDSVYRESYISSISSTKADKPLTNKKLYKKLLKDLDLKSSDYNSTRDLNKLNSVVNIKSNNSNSDKAKENKNLLKDIDDLLDDIYDYDDDKPGNGKGNAYGLYKKTEDVVNTNNQEELFLLERLSQLAQLIADAEDHDEYLELLDKKAQQIQKEIQKVKDINQKNRLKAKFENNIGLLEGMLKLMDDKSSMREATEIQINAYKRMLAWVF